VSDHRIAAIETRVVCPLCEGSLLIILEAGATYRQIACWLCIKGTVSKNVYADWKSAGCPKEEPFGWINMP
jgi:hypothetical protein